MNMEALDHMSSQLCPELEQLGQILGVHLVHKILDSPIGIDLSDWDKKGKDNDGPPGHDKCALDAWHSSSTAWQ